MSHTMNVKIEMHDRTALEAACERLNLKMEAGTFQFYEGRETGSNETGLGVYLHGWTYPVVVKEDGTIAYDNYRGSWGDIARLNELKAYYGLEKAKIEARRHGFSLVESLNSRTNELVLTIRVGE